MKKIFNICLLLAVTAGFVACSDDNDAGSGYLRENPVKVVNSNLTFTAAAQKGGVKFTAPAGSTVSVSDSWATAQLQNDSIVVSVTNNPAVDSRSAVLTIKNGNDSTNLPILQAGSVFKYNGPKYIVVGNDETTLSLPYTKVGAEPTMTVLDKADAATVTSIEDKDTAFTAHITANTTGEIRTFSLCLNNQEKRDTITVTQGSIDNFVGKNYVLFGYDILKMTANTGNISELMTQISGKFQKTSDNQLTLVADSSSIKIHFDFDPSTLSLTLKGGDDILSEASTAGTKVYRTAVWDVAHYAAFVKLIKQTEKDHAAGSVSDDDYNSFNNSTQPAIYNFYASNKLSMSAMMVNAKEDGIVVGILGEPGSNVEYSRGLRPLAKLGFPIESFTANMLGVYEYTSVSQKLTFKKPLIMLQAVMLYHPLSKATPAKLVNFLQKKADAKLPGLRFGK